MGEMFLWKVTERRDGDGDMSSQTVACGSRLLGMIEWRYDALDDWGGVKITE